MAINEVSAKLVLDTKQAQRDVRTIESEIKKLDRQSIKLSADSSNLSSLKSELSQTKSQIDTLTKQTNVVKLQADTNKLNELRTRVQEIKAQIASLRQEKVEIQAKTNLSDSDKTRLKEINTLIRQLNAEKGVIVNVQMPSLQKSESELKAFQKELTSLQNKKAQIELRIQNGENAKAQLQDINRQIADKQNQVARKKVEIQGAEQAKAKLQQIAQAQRELKDKTVRIRVQGEGIEELGNKMLNVFSPNGNGPISKLNQFLIKGIGYSTIFRATSSAIRGMNDALSGAVSRYDQLTVASRNFKNMGFKESDINSMTKALDKSIEGLPTTLNDAFGHITKMASVNNNLSRSQKLFSAFNDAILTFGGDSEKVNRAIEQYSQIMGTKMDARTLRSLREAGMAPVLKEVANKLGVDYTEFTKAFTGNNPSISLKEFEDALIDLDKNGGVKLKSLAAMSKDSVATIGNAFGLIKIRMSKAGADILQTIDKTAVKLTGKNIYQHIYDFTEGITQGGKGVTNWIKSHGTEIQSFFTQLGNGFNTLKNIAVAVFTPIKGLITLIGGGNFGSGLARTVTAWIGLGTALKVAGKAIQTFSGPLAMLSNYLGKTGAQIGVLDKLKQKLGGLTGGTTKPSKLPTGEVPQTQFDTGAFKSMLSKHVNRFANIAELGALAGDMILYAKAIQELSKAMPKDLGSFAAQMGALTATVATMEALSVAVSKVGKMTGGNFDGIMSLMGQGGALILIAKGLQELSKIKGTFGNIAGKIGAMTLAVGALSGLSAAIGGLGVLTSGVSTAAMGTGLLTMLAQGGTLWVLAKSLQEVNKLPSDFGDVGSKITKLMNTINQISSAIASSNSWVDNLPVIGTIKKGFDALNGFADALKNASLATTLKGLVAVNTNLSKLSKTEVIKAGDVKSKIKAIADTMRSLQDDTFAGAMKGFDSSDKTANYAATATGFAQTVEGFVSASKNLKRLEKFSFDIEGVKQKFKSIKDVTQALMESGLKDNISAIGKDAKPFQNLSKVMNGLKGGLEAISNMSSMQAMDTWAIEKIRDSVRAIKPLFSMLTSKETDSKGKDVKGSSMTEQVGKIGEQAKSFSKLASVFQGLGEAFNALKALSAQFEGMDEKGIDNLTKPIKVMQNILKMFDTNMKGDKESSVVDLTKNIGEQAKSFQALPTAINSMVAAVESLKNLQTVAADLNVGEVGKGGIADTISQIQKALKLFAGDGKKNDGLSDAVGGVNKINYAGLSEKINQFTTVVTALQNLQSMQVDPAQIQTLTNNIKQSINAISGLKNDLGGAKTITQAIDSIAQSIQGLVTQIQAMSDSFVAAGTSLGNAVVDGFNRVDVAGKMNQKISSAANSLGKGGSAFRSQGTKMGNKFVEGLNSALKTSVSASSIAQALSQSGGFREAGVSLGNQLIIGLKSAVAGANVTVNVTATTRASAGGIIGNSAAQVVNQALSFASSIFNRATGGPVYKANGGMLAYFEPKGTDTVPAMLTPGEFVMKRRAVNMFGSDFMEKVNRMDVKGAFESLKARYNVGDTKVVNVTNNNTVNNYDNRSIQIDGSKGEASARLKAGRWMRALS